MTPVRLCRARMATRGLAWGWHKLPCALCSAPKGQAGFGYSKCSRGLGAPGGEGSGPSRPRTPGLGFAGVPWGREAQHPPQGRGSGRCSPG